MMTMTMIDDDDDYDEYDTNCNGYDDEEERP